MPGVSLEQIIDTAVECCVENAVEFPDEMKSDFLQYVSNVGEIKTPRDPRVKVCRKINAILENDERLNLKYGAIRDRISDHIVWKIAILMKDPGSQFKKFFATLKPGQSWNMSAFITSSKESKSVYKWIWKKKRSVGPKVMRDVLGKEADDLLTRNPFIYVEHYRWDYPQIKLKIKEFLTGLPEGEVWHPVDFMKWEDQGRRWGEVIVQWLRTHSKSSLTAAVLNDILGDETEELLKRNPFEKRNHSRWSIERAKAMMKEFFTYLDSKGIKVWSYLTLAQWRSDDGTTGRDLYNYFQGDFRRSGCGVDWLRIFIELVDVEDIKKFRFQHQRNPSLSFGGNELEAPERTSPVFSTGNPDFEPILRSMPDETTPESLVIAQEDEIKLNEAIQALPPQDFALTQKFLDGEELEPSDFSRIVSLLKKRIFR